MYVIKVCMHYSPTKQLLEGSVCAESDMQVQAILGARKGLRVATYWWLHLRMAPASITILRIQQPCVCCAGVPGSIRERLLSGLGSGDSRQHISIASSRSAITSRPVSGRAEEWSSSQVQDLADAISRDASLNSSRFTYYIFLGLQLGLRDFALGFRVQ